MGGGSEASRAAGMNRYLLDGVAVDWEALIWKALPMNERFACQRSPTLAEAIHVLEVAGHKIVPPWEAGIKREGRIERGKQ